MNFKGKMVSLGVDMHEHSWRRITALVESETSMAVSLTTPTYDSFKKLLAQFASNPGRVIST